MIGCGKEPFRNVVQVIRDAPLGWTRKRSKDRKDWTLRLSCGHSTRRVTYGDVKPPKRCRCVWCWRQGMYPQEA